ncbi:site-specific DNA-methyltransferase [Corynebacterium durum]|uniref:site-specific DNA-methyltransferase n=1 Tax=Corynebacterium durum TaxID=61592 RepID=UPI004028A131
MSDQINEVPATSPNFQSEAAQKLASLFPEVIADGKIDVAALQTLLGDDAAGGGERFGLFWPGKTQAIRAAQTPTTATLEPDRENSVDWNTTQNVVIEGDNLEVLKILQKHYYGKIKMIYIDPPYNTGNDFVYEDDYADPIGTYLDITGQRDGDGKLSTNTESVGRFHSNWLNMMYPRLKLARNLLREDGALFVSIDDNEVNNLKLLLDNIFGESNFVAMLIAQTNPRGRTFDRFIAKTHEYVLVYTRSSSRNALRMISKSEKAIAGYNKSDARGQYRLLELRNRNPVFNRENRPNLFYPFYADPDTMEVSLVRTGTHTQEIFPRNSVGEDSCWTWGKDKALENLALLVSHQASTGKWTIFRKDYLDEQSSLTKSKSILLDAAFNHEHGKEEVRALFEKTPFNFPKSVSLIKYLLRLGSSGDDVVLDFFAGSGTTAHAVMALNAEDGGRRQCISVQLPEPAGEKAEARKAGYEMISEITRERIRRAGAKILEEEGSKFDGRAESLDVGFRAYKLVDTNFTKWRVDSSLDPKELKRLFKGMRKGMKGSADDASRPEALLTEILLKLGFSLTEHIEHVDVADLHVFSVMDGLVMAYLNECTKPKLKDLRALIALEPERLVILEDAFQDDDELKANLVQECRTHGVDLWTA